MAESSNSQNTNETELTMCDVLDEERELEDDANAVLGGSDDTNCSYDKGYVPRQALYACTTCSVDQEPSGICLACSYKCHDGHEVVELYTKRNFRCDCGNSKFSDKTCSLKPDKEHVNKLNKYNQNFKGLYCSCSRPYPDLEDNVSDEMIQCIMCEDWYHGRHIGAAVPEDYFEMICAKCMESHRFLYSYLNKFCYVSVSDDSKENCKGSPVSSSLDDAESVLPLDCQKKEANVATDPAEKTDLPIKKDEISLKSEPDTTIKQENTDCYLNKFVIQPDGIVEGPAFWPENWRRELCRCSNCLDMYQERQCAYILDIGDTILAYEESGKSTTESQYDKGLNALSQLDRVKQMEAVRAYTNMKGQLKEYLKGFADRNKTVSEQDIKEFFERIGNKRQRLGNGVPHFCR